MTTLSPAQARDADVGAASAAEIAAIGVRDAQKKLDEARAQREEAAKVARRATREHREAQERFASDAKYRLSQLRQTLAAALALAERARPIRPEPPIRQQARSWVHDGGARELMALTENDPAAGALLDCAHAAGRLMRHLGEGFADEDVQAAADALECEAWRATML